MWLVIPEDEKERAEFFAERERSLKEAIATIERCFYYDSDPECDDNDDTVFEPVEPKDVGFKPAYDLFSMPSDCFVSQKFDEFAQDGLDLFKKEHPKSDYQFSEVSEVNFFEGAGLYYYVTFEARDASGSLETFQMSGFKYHGPRTSDKVDMCRLKEPRQEENSSEEISDNYGMLETRQEENSSEEISDNDNMLEIRQEEISDNKNMLETSRYDTRESGFDGSGAISV